MVMILQFRRPDDDVSDCKPPVDASDAPRQSAEIIIFPGVRIERAASNDDSPPDADPVQEQVRSPGRHD